MLARGDALDLPKNPLDDIIHRLGGPSKVAEMTGRKHRLVMQPDGTYLYQARAENSDCPPDKVRGSVFSGGTMVPSAGSNVVTLVVNGKIEEEGCIKGGLKEEGTRGGLDVVIAGIS